MDWPLLKSVSRSFYLSVRVLPKGLREVIGVGYLLCRAADTVADAIALSNVERLELLGRFRSVFDGFPLQPSRMAPLLKDLEQSNLALTSSEGKLLAGFGRCVSYFNGLSRTDQTLVQAVVRAVIEGMEKDLKTFGESAETVKALRTEADLESYITLIGGEPGRFWSRACLEHVPDLKPRDRQAWIDHGVTFGKGLQLVNILRDLSQDLKNGRCYIPEGKLRPFGLSAATLHRPESNEALLSVTHDLIDHTVGYLRHGLSYLEDVPRARWNLRAAVWWPLVIGMKTLRNLRQKPVVMSETVTKIRRWEVYRSVGASLALLPVDRLLKAKFEGLAEDAASHGIGR